jgi:hypothetical protein
LGNLHGDQRRPALKVAALWVRLPPAAAEPPPPLPPRRRLRVRLEPAFGAPEAFA